MHCPFCQMEDTKVIDSRLGEDGMQVRRRRECPKCQERFTTFEKAELMMPRVIKRDGQRANFSEEKLRQSFLKSLEKRPINTEKVDAIVSSILHKLRISGEREVTSQAIGELVMNELRALDEVAYVRYASVYRSFQDVNAFHEEISKLQDKDKK